MKTMKYKLLKDEKKITNYGVVYRIVALKDFTASNGRKVKLGDLGGYCSTDDVLNHSDNSWVFDNAMLSNAALSNTTLQRDSKVFAGSLLNSQIENRVLIDGPVLIENSTVKGFTEIHDSASIKNSTITGGKIYGNQTEINDCTIKDYPTIKNCKVNNSTIADTVVLANSQITNSNLGGYINLNSERIVDTTNIGSISLNVESGN